MKRYDFASDNTAPISPAVWEALAQANRDAVPSYGEDRWTKRARELVRELFETDCNVFFTFNGTAANVHSRPGISDNPPVRHAERSSKITATDTCLGVGASPTPASSMSAHKPFRIVMDVISN